ncbi:hypothetical protein P153DRAFT_423281 [Dothidotthia symphoricarpi CBS 119687]|uniref:t-SNARE coiled-coil homology domain-containing protein n=1 Tax=Dothidotthia symphoricarpi CBS 119687 TaxID=1392245 RepID=A0A6A6AC33_9PLEO|nr:uncharacterized protein P153DRAFT_423281 [Dothidotthia symphoricarpi CBS 119687]KAF2128793.1 hypothetical protein P153DRAFT_423281 [Dothidotthia symphoricarpi CBS 119687]
MSSRFGRQDARDDLFSSYNRSASPSKSKKAKSPYGVGGYGFGGSNGSVNTAQADTGFGAYPGSGRGNGNGNGNGNGYGMGLGVNGGGGGGYGDDNTFRSATPNSRGQYSSAVLDELESQNDEQVGVLTSKVKMLKDLTHLIGDEIRDSTSLAEKMNDQFENSRNKLKGTMNRMLRMAQKTGVGWRVWLGFFAAVTVLFWWVWLG